MTWDFCFLYIISLDMFATKLIYKVIPQPIDPMYWRFYNSTVFSLDTENMVALVSLGSVAVLGKKIFFCQLVDILSSQHLFSQAGNRTSCIRHISNF